MDMNDVVTGVVLSKACSIKADKDSEETKQVILNVKFDNVTLGDVFAKAMGGAVIQWQNGPGRKHFATWTSGQNVSVMFKSPGKAPQIDPETAIMAKLSGMSSKEEKQRYLEELMAKAEQ